MTMTADQERDATAIRDDIEEALLKALDKCTDGGPRGRAIQMNVCADLLGRVMVAAIVEQDADAHERCNRIFQQLTMYVMTATARPN